MAEKATSTSGWVSDTPGGGTDGPSGHHRYRDRYVVCLGDEDGEADESEDAPMKLQAKAERSHLIVWQLMMADD